MSGELGVEIIRGTHWSAPGCHNGCGLLYHVKDGRLLKVEGDPEHPFNQGRLCPRCLALTQVVYHPDRILHPLKRVGERGEGKWQQITWKEAFDSIEAKFKEIKALYGGPSIVFTQGTGRDIGGWISMLAYSLGSPNWVMAFLSGIACYTPCLASQHVVMGAYTQPDCSQWLAERYNSPIWRPPKTMIIWGSDPLVAHSDTRFGAWIPDCMKKGTELIVIDPTCGWLASRAQKWLRVRPGTDAALSLAFLNVMLQENLYDREFVVKKTNSPHLVRIDTNRILRESDVKTDGRRENFIVWDQTRKDVGVWNSTSLAYDKPDVKPALEVGAKKIRLADGSEVVCKTVWQALLDRINEYPLDKVEEITWVPKKDIIEAARLYAGSRPSAIWTGVALDQEISAIPLQQAITIMRCITNNVDVPGGDIIVDYPWNISAYPYDSSSQIGQASIREMMKVDERVRRIGIDKYPMIANFRTWAHSDETIKQIISEKPYPIKAMWIQTSNFLSTGAPDPKSFYEAVRKLDFIVAVDLFMTPTALALADIFLPVCTHTEKFSIKTWWQLCAMTKPIEPIGESKSDLEINLELGRRFNPKIWPWKNVEEMLDTLLIPSGMKFQELKEKSWALEPIEHYYYRYDKGRLRRDGKKGFRTPDGKMDLYSVLLEEWNLDPLPYHEEPPYSPINTPGIYEQYPLIMMTGRRSWGLFHSEHRQIPWMREIEPNPTVEIHPETAENYGIRSGDWIWIENQFGRCKRKAVISINIHPKTIQVPHAWWQPEEKDPKRLFNVFDLNVNQLFPVGMVGPSGLGTAYKSMLSKIYKAQCDANMTAF